MRIAGNSMSCMSSPNGMHRKYRNIITQPHLDGIFSSGLLSRIFDAPIRFRLIIRRAKYSVILGVPISRDLQVFQSFIIDVVNCEQFYGAALQTNLILCDSSYGSLTDLVVDAFNLEIPNDFLDAVYDIATRNIHADAFSEKLLLAWLLSEKSAHEELAILVKAGLWDRVRDWIQKATSVDLAGLVKFTVNKIRDNLQVVAPQVAMISFSIKDAVEKIAAKYLLYAPPLNAPIILLLGCDGRQVKLCYISSRSYDLTILSRSLERMGYITIARPNVVRVYLDENIDYFVDRLVAAVKSTRKYMK